MAGKKDRKPEVIACGSYSEFFEDKSLYQWAHNNDLIDWARETLGSKPRRKRGTCRKSEIKSCKSYTEFSKDNGLYQWARNNNLIGWARKTLNAKPRKPRSKNGVFVDNNGDKPVEGLRAFMSNCKNGGKKVDISNEEYLHHESISNCECCGDSFENRRKCLDHDHDTGKYRGTLCVRCNSAEGQLLGSVERAYKMLQYISERN